jgi:hypothetical protein
LLETIAFRALEEKAGVPCRSLQPIEIRCKMGCQLAEVERYQIRGLLEADIDRLRWSDRPACGRIRALIRYLRGDPVERLQILLQAAIKALL